MRTPYSAVIVLMSLFANAEAHAGDFHGLPIYPSCRVIRTHDNPPTADANVFGISSECEAAAEESAVIAFYREQLGSPGKDTTKQGDLKTLYYAQYRLSPDLRDIRVATSALSKHTYLHISAMKIVKRNNVWGSESAKTLANRCAYAESMRFGGLPWDAQVCIDQKIVLLSAVDGSYFFRFTIASEKVELSGFGFGSKAAVAPAYDELSRFSVADVYRLAETIFAAEMPGAKK